MTPRQAPHPDDMSTYTGDDGAQGRNALAPPGIDLERVWVGVAAGIWADPIGPAERLARRLLHSPGLARALLTTPSLVFSWIMASAGVLAIGVLVTLHTGTPWAALLAPALAGASIAYAYGPGIDPAFELSQTTPISDRMILLVRGLAVFGVNAILGIVASLFTATAVELTLGWLVPMTTVSAGALAVATLARSANLGLAAALAGWCLVVFGSAVGTGDLATAVSGGGVSTLAYVLSTVLCGIVALHTTSGRESEGARWQWQQR